MQLWRGTPHTTATMTSRFFMSDSESDSDISEEPINEPQGISAVNFTVSIIVNHDVTLVDIYYGIDAQYLWFIYLVHAADQVLWALDPAVMFKLPLVCRFNVFFTCIMFLELYITIFFPHVSSVKMKRTQNVWYAQLKRSVMKNSRILSKTSRTVRRIGTWPTSYQVSERKLNYINDLKLLYLLVADFLMGFRNNIPLISL